MTTSEETRSTCRAAPVGRRRTGSPEEIRKVANAYKAFYAKLPIERSGDYSVDHAGVIYLMGRAGEYLGFMPPQTSPDRLTEVLRKYLAK